MFAGGAMHPEDETIYQEVYEEGFAVVWAAPAGSPGPRRDGPTASAPLSVGPGLTRQRRRAAGTAATAQAL
jgi:hypothetical protein